MKNDHVIVTTIKELVTVQTVTVVTNQTRSGAIAKEVTNMKKELSNNAKRLKLEEPWWRGESVNFIATAMGWGWHRTNNTMIELGWK